jgi:hypothetical protein
MTAAMDLVNVADLRDFEAVTVLEDFAAAGERWDAFRATANDFLRGFFDGLLFGIR